MPVNSSFLNASLPNPPFSPMENYIYCLITRPSSFIYITFVITNIFLVLPLCIFILHRGVQRWLQKRSSASMSHSDCFTYHMVIIELIGVSGNILVCCGVYRKDENMIVKGDVIFCFTMSGQLLLHMLTCVDRYLAVVHPITYLSLRNEKGIRIRIISIGCVWLLCLTVVVLQMSIKRFSVIEVCLLSSSMTINSFCSLFVLCALIRPGPGEQGGGRERADASKQRAFYTMVAILGVLVLRSSWGLILSGLSAMPEKINCVTALIEGWINLPSSLVLPLLFMYKEGKLVCCKNNVHCR